MLIEARVLDRQHRLAHHLRNLADRREQTALFSVLADQHLIGGEDAQGQLGPVIGEAADLGQVRVGHGQRDRQQREATQQS